MVKICLPVQEAQETRVQSLGREGSLGRHGNPRQYSCMQNPHGEWSLVGYSPWGCKGLGMTKRLSRHTQTHTYLTIACQSPLSMECSRQEYWSGLPFPSAGDLPDPGIKSTSPALQAYSLLFEPSGKSVHTDTQTQTQTQTHTQTHTHTHTHTSLQVLKFMHYQYSNFALQFSVGCFCSLLPVSSVSQFMSFFPYVPI